VSTYGADVASVSSVPAPSALLTHRQRVIAIVTGSSGNLLEWFDFYIYAFTALYFAPSFFPEGDRTAQLLNVAGIYAVGFLTRPIGGWFFGRLADRRGRRVSMIASVLLMGVGALMVAVLPTYASIGAWAPALLLVARLLQGFSTGGQYAAAATYLSEVAANTWRGFYASFQFVTLIGGQLGALFVLILLQRWLNDEALRAWGWRIPFALGAMIALAVPLLRNQLHETVREGAARPADAGSLMALARHPKALFIVMSLSAAGAVSLYTFTTYMQKFLVNTAGMDVTTASGVMLFAMLFFMIMQPLIGAFSDRVGRRQCLMLFAGLMTLCAVPLLNTLSTVREPRHAFLLVAASLGILSFYTSVSGLFKAELFPQHIRALGVGMGHGVSAAIFGGSAEFLALLFKQAGQEQLYFWYVALICGSAFVTALFMREPRRASMTD
jgi:MHS family alpha-ketoglutarate permease-like MFS transporter